VGANRISFLDSVLLMLDTPRRISFVAKAEYMQSWKTRFVFPALRMIPIDRATTADAAGRPTTTTSSPPPSADAHTLRSKRTTQSYTRATSPAAPSDTRRLRRPFGGDEIVAVALAQE